MSQVPTKTSSYIYDDLTSSPDPLATSFDDDQVVGSVASRKEPSPSKAKSAYLAKGQRRPSRTTHHDFGTIPSSPFRAVSEQNISPWKIRVTVEAKQEESDMDHPASRRITRTVKIPLRQDSSLLEETNGPLRGRRSQASPSKSKRSATPVREGRNGVRSRRQSVTDLNVRPLGDDAEEDDWLRQKRSPRKRKPSQTRKSVRGGGGNTQTSSSQSAEKSNVSEFEIRQDTDAESDDGVIHQGQATSGRESSELRAMDLNRVSTRARALSTKSMADPEGQEQDIEDNNAPAALPPRKSVEARKVSANSAKSYPTPSPTSSYRGDSDHVDKPMEDISPGHEAFDTILESEGFTMIDLDTLPSAKQFLSSPAELEANNSAGSSNEASENRESATALNRHDQHSSQQNKPVHPELMTYPVLNHDESDLSSTVPSSPPVSEQEKSLLQVPSSSSSAGRKVTPQPYSSPKLPSPPKQDVQRTSNHRSRGSVSALVAGIALQGVVSPKQSRDGGLVREKRTSSPVTKSDNPGPLFQGFDYGTQRELRAGLRFGEELAKRQSPNQPATASASHSSADKESKPLGLGISTFEKSQANVANHPATQIWRGENLVQRTPVQVSASTASKETVVERSPPHTPQPSSLKEVDEKLLDTQARREREWQLERDEIIRQIQNANESQVIVIDSDSEDDDDEGQEGNDRPGLFEQLTADADAEEQAEEEEDIWLAEAKNSSSPGPEAHENDFPTRTEQVRQREPPKEVLSRPRRSLIPSPWKRGEDIDTPQEQISFVSTNAEEISGLLFYKEPESKVLFGAGEIKRQQLRQRRGSGRFDIDLMAGTPPKVNVEDEKDETSTSDSLDNEEESIEDSAVSNSTAGRASEHDDGSNISPDALETLQDHRNDISGSPEAASSPAQPARVPVMFNDSSISIAAQPDVYSQPIKLQLQPPSPEQHMQLSSPQRPPTPRSALKGSRQSLGEGLAGEGLNTPTMIRRVVFSERSRGVDIDGLESSFSMRSASDDSTAGEVHGQLNRELQFEWQSQRPAHEPARTGNACYDEQTGSHEKVRERRHHPSTNAEVWIPVDIAREARSAPQPEPEPAPVKKGWTSWLWGSRTTPEQGLDSSSYSDAEQGRDQTRSRSRTTSTEPYKPPHMDGTKDDPEDDDSQDQLSGWEKTKSSIPSSTSASASVSVSTSKKAQTRTEKSTQSQRHPQSQSQSHSRHHHPQTTQPNTARTVISTHHKSSSAAAAAAAASSHHHHDHDISTVKIPSYLLPPSYPSDPSRSARSTTSSSYSSAPLPLSLEGKFTNTHFRTLHIIYRKSLRPKFHAPPRHTIRSEIMALHGCEMEIDESAHIGGDGDGDGDEDGERNGDGDGDRDGNKNSNSPGNNASEGDSSVGGVFVWKVGLAECEVLERFMQECEFSQGIWMGREVLLPEQGLHHRFGVMSDDGHGDGRGGVGVGVGIDGSGNGNVRLGRKVRIAWGWSVEQLAEWLCRIVVGEVVREEERKVKMKLEMKARTKMMKTKAKNRGREE
ncbi:hypothetical protein A1O1_05556 [Capronia coronata CBS 617.96]|uniref:Uncharacterized protein n=1 Tax=Capronia coronata CBS 617.96 TaxID=1182541 RepID=W9YH82_9EURO|nr:uncharacterized protein A1O1_05556 [Capronia coronata CBS 617.96]EXJ88626.1 hypothetical protein A1O1_05556 [Capronia coronata CBS 617.96]